MARFASVVVESKLLRLDREFDFIIPDGLEAQARVGQRVTFKIGRNTNPSTGFITKLSDESEFATAELISIVDTKPVLNADVYSFCRAVADRQAVSVGEILHIAIPDHMPRTQFNKSTFGGVAPQQDVEREVMLGSGNATASQAPDWLAAAIERIRTTIHAGMSALVIVPDSADVVFVQAALRHSDLDPISLHPGEKGSEKFQKFHEILSGHNLVVGTRSAIYAPVANLGLVCVIDDLDDSHREVGVPFTHSRELALMRAGEHASVFFAAPYRSVELQRLVELGYLTEVAVNTKPPKISYASNIERIDEISFSLIRDGLKVGPVLVLLPRKGVSAAIFCQGCGERQLCSCGGYIWEPDSGKLQCRLCGKPHSNCVKCKSDSLRKGRSGSNRTAAELGKAFPGSKIVELTAEKKSSVKQSPNQIVVATPGAAPRVPGGYSALLVIDTDIWLSRQTLYAEQLALRDWSKAVDLLAPGARVHLNGLDESLGRPLALWQHVQLASAALNDAKSLKLPPATRIATIEGEANVVLQALTAASSAGAKTIRNNGESATISFGYAQGMKVAKELKAIALAASTRSVKGRRQRGLKVFMDDPRAL